MEAVLPGLVVVLFLAYANGANDNFKGVATLYGSGAATFHRALGWATLTTALGSCAALLLAKGLIAAFSGKGLVPDSVVATSSFPLAVGMAAGATVMLATKFGFPISTTHALTGALAGAGLVASPAGLNLPVLASSFFAPLLISPFAAVALAFTAYPLFRYLAQRAGAQRKSCLCVGAEIPELALASASPGFAAYAPTPLAGSLTLTTGTEESCATKFQGQFTAVSAGPTMDVLHYLSSGIVGFARGLNDTPKIAAILLASSALPVSWAIVTVTICMAIGGLINSRKVAEIMSHKVTSMDPGQGFTANVITGFLVIFASKWGLPVSTTHVSCGALFGIGGVTRQANWPIVARILTAWITTLPVAACLGAIAYALLQTCFLSPACILLPSP